MATRLKPSEFGYQNFYSATLTGDITAGTLAIPLDTVPSPTAGILVIEPDSASREVILYTSKGASTVTAPADGRGYSGTTAGSHLQGSTVIMAPIDKWFTALASGELSTDPLRTEFFFDHVNSGMVWSGDAYGSTRNASMTAGVIYIGGRRYTATAVTARSFTASKDTYIDAEASTDEDGTATLTYTEVTNNAASPALAANNVRIGIVVTGASTIAAAGSVNQGQEDKVLPIASSVAYSVTDSLGNLICPRDPNRKLLGYRQVTSNFTSSSTTVAAEPALSCPVIVPAGRKITISLFNRSASSNSSTGYSELGVYDGTTAGTRLTQASMGNVAANGEAPLNASRTLTPTVTSKTYCIGKRAPSTGTATFTASADYPCYIKVELT